MNKLTIELVPSTSWYTNLRSMLPAKEWDVIRKQVYKDAGHKCEICREDGIHQHLTRWPVEAHEIWEYNDDTHTQVLVGIQALCPKCHYVKHIGLSQLRGPQRMDMCIRHLMKINKMTSKEAKDYIEESFRIYRERSQHEWETDISYIDKWNKTLKIIRR